MREITISIDSGKKFQSVFKAINKIKIKQYIMITK